MAKLFCINSRCRPFLFNQPQGTPGNDSVQRFFWHVSAFENS